MIEFIIGQARSGKTTRCYKEIERALTIEAYHNLIVLVPEQFNLQVQVELAKRLYPGLLRVEVMSFNNLSEKLIKEVSGIKMPVIDDLERIMILKKILEEHKNELSYFKKSYSSDGFVDGMNRLMTIFEQNQIDQNFLQALTTEETGEVFKCKLKDMTHIHQWFNSYIENKFITVEKTIERMASCIKDSKYLEGAYVWIDGFFGFTMPQLGVVYEMMDKVGHCSITLPMDKAYGIDEYILPTHPFYDSIRNYQKLLAFCESRQIPYKVKYMEEAKEMTEVESLSYMKASYLKPFVKPYPKEQEEVVLHQYSNREEEIEETAKQIKELIRDKGYRYHDIALLVGELDQYKSSLANTFKEYDIPCFMDTKRHIHTTPLVAVILFALEVITSRWQYKNMMQLLRLNMFGLQQETIDSLENYILEHGIQGEAKWCTPWERESSWISLEDINSLRQRVVEPLMLLKKHFEQYKDKKGRLSIQDATVGIYQFLEYIGAYETLQERKAYYEAKGERVLMQESGQIWGQVVEVMERLVDILGSEKISVSVYKNILKTSFSYIKMGMIPPSKDQVMIGTVDRSRLPQLKALFILGVNEGSIPKADDSMNLFSDMDKVTFAQLSKNKDEKRERLVDVLINQPLFGNQFIIYSVLTRPTEQLVVSTLMGDENGKSLRPSIVFYKLRKMFGSESTPYTSIREVQSPGASLDYLGRQLRNYLESDTQLEDKIWYDVVSWYLEDEVWRSKVLGMSKDLTYTNQQHYLQKEHAKLLYSDQLETNISQLETYRQCPCCYFIKYGIKASERKMLKWNAADLGTLFHATLERYPKELEKKGLTWVDATEEEMKKCVAEAVRYSVARTTYAGRDDGRIKFTLSKVERMSERAIGALTYQLKQGKFTPYAYEVSFGYEGLPPIKIELDEEHTILLKGQIDRVDLYVKSENERYIKILDYKSGNKQFSLLEVFHSLQLQLLLYLDAYLRLSPTHKPAGMFYFHIDSKRIKYELGMEEEKILHKQLKQFKLSGLLVDDVEVIDLMEEGIEGDIVPAKVKKDGTLAATSSVASERQFDMLRAYMINRIQLLGKDMLDGKISAKPCKLKDKDACAYCKYQTICQFDQNSFDNEYERLENLKEKEIWEQMTNEVVKGDM